jgi:hypothetical protein
MDLSALYIFQRKWEKTRIFPQDSVEHLTGVGIDVLWFCSPGLIQLSKHINAFFLAIQEYLLLDEKLRILKKHFRLSDEGFQGIINQHRVPTKTEKEILE